MIEVLLQSTILLSKWILSVRCHIKVYNNELLLLILLLLNELLQTPLKLCTALQRYINVYYYYYYYYYYYCITYIMYCMLAACQPYLTVTQLIDKRFPLVSSKHIVISYHNMGLTPLKSAIRTHFYALQTKYYSELH